MQTAAPENYVQDDDKPFCPACGCWWYNSTDPIDNYHLKKCKNPNCREEYIWEPHLPKVPTAESGDGTRVVTEDDAGLRDNIDAIYLSKATVEMLNATIAELERDKALWKSSTENMKMKFEAAKEMVEKRDAALRAAERVVALGDDAHPGLATWTETRSHAHKELKAALMRAAMGESVT